MITKDKKNIVIATVLIVCMITAIVWTFHAIFVNGM